MAINEQHLINFLKDRVTIDELTGDTLLFSSGILDSVNQLDLIAFIETEGSISIDQFDITLDNFDSINNILAFVGKKLCN